MPEVSFTLNGRHRTVTYEQGMHFLEVLREILGVTSPKDGCAPQGYCGCCAILIDGRPALACLRKPEHVAGKTVTTLEGIPEAQRAVLSRAFVQEGAIQCGFCIPGIVVTTAALLAHNPNPTDDEIRQALAGHLCRCGAHTRILRAVRRAARELEEARS